VQTQLFEFQYGKDDWVFKVSIFVTFYDVELFIFILFLLLFILLYVYVSINSLSLFVKTNRERNYWFLGCNFGYTMVCLILFKTVAATLILLHTDSATHYFGLVFSAYGLCRKLVLCALWNCFKTCCYTCFVYVQIMFCGTYQVQKIQHKQTKDLSPSNRGRLLNEILWCLQICVESLKTLLMFVCVLSSCFLTC